MSDGQSFHEPVPGDQQTPPAGWYPNATGHQQYWDGQQWTENYAPGAVLPVLAPGTQPVVTPGAIGNAQLVHILALFTGIIGAGIMYAISSDKTAYERHHAAEAVNFTLTMIIAAMISVVLCLVLIGFLILPVLIVIGWVFPIMAAMAAGRGEWYRYPLTIRFINSPIGN